jgi:hypothetical protein
MKYLIILIMSVLCQFGVAQDMPLEGKFDYQYNNVLRLSPIELGRAEFQVGYERYFAHRTQSLVLNPSIIKGSRGTETKDGYQLMVQYRFYLSQLQRATNETLNMFNIGFYAAPYVLGLTYKETYEYGIYDPLTFEQDFQLIEEAVDALEGGALLGIQLDITRRIVLDFFVGGGIRESNVTSSNTEGRNEYGILDLAYSGVKPRIGFQMGITF